MAEALFRHRLELIGEASNWRVESAGTWAHDGAPASRRAQHALRAWNIDLSAHRSRNITRDLLQSFDLILVMERGHREALEVEFPEEASRIHRLSEMAGHTFDVPDPMGGTLADISKVVNEIQMLLVQGFARICELTTSEWSHQVHSVPQELRLKPLTEPSIVFLQERS